MPWPAVFLLIALLAIGIIPGAMLAGDNAGAVVLGVLAGVFSSLVSPKRQIPWPLIAGGLALGLMVLFPTRPALFLFAISLSAICGWETTKTGGRSGVMALFLCVGLQLTPAMPPLEQAALPALLGLAFGWLATQATPLAGQACQPPAPLRFGVGIAVFLSAGLAIAVFAIHHVQESLAHWLAMLFLLRAMAPPGELISGAVRFGIGTITGSLVALLLITLGLPPTLMLAGGGLMFLMGLRMLPHPWPYAPAAFSAAVLMATAPSIHAAIFRIEAAVFAVFISTALATMFAVVWTAVERAQASKATSSGS